MLKVPTANYLDSEQIDERARMMELEANILPLGNQKSSLVEGARRLRICADMKRLLSLSRT